MTRALTIAILLVAAFSLTFVRKTLALDESVPDTGQGLTAATDTKAEEAAEKKAPDGEKPRPNSADGEYVPAKYDGEYYNGYRKTKRTSRVKKQLTTGLDLEVQARHPVSLQFSGDGNFLYVANRRSGTCSVVAMTDYSVVNEVKLGQQLEDLQRMGESGLLLAVDHAGHELILFRAEGEKLEVLQREPVARYPVSIAVRADGRQVVIASLWSRQLTFFDFDVSQAKLTAAGKLDLEIAPREQVFANDESLIVADAFGSEIAIVDARRKELRFLREYPGHNIRGLSLNLERDKLVSSYQTLNELAHTVRNDIHWGLLASNDLRWAELDKVLDETSNIYKRAHVQSLGNPGDAAGDPGSFAVAPDGTVVVAISGTDEVEIGLETEFEMQRLAVGDRPTDVVIHPSGKLACVANTFDDSVSVIDLQQRKETWRVSLGEGPELKLVDHGERLFFDASLSHDSWLSCQSCHSEGHTNGMLSDNFSDQSFGAPKRVLSLLGRSETLPLAWHGHVQTFEAQVRNSIEQTMQSSFKPSEEQVSAIVAYVKQLPAPPALDVARECIDEVAVQRGERLFGELNCIDCHAPPSYTTPDVYDVGLEDVKERRMFNPPPLRGVSQRRRFFHDGRANSLPAVFSQYRHQLDRELSAEELRDLLAFLRSI